jgi:ribose transport system permease protein
MSHSPATAESAATALEAGQAAPRGARWRLRLGLISRLRDFAIVAILLVLFIVLAVTNDVFLTSGNLTNVVDQSVAIGLIAIGGALVIIAGGFDLSGGATFTVGAILAVEFTNEVGIALGIAGALVTGAGLGLVNGLVTTVGRINYFVGTLATSIVFTGLGLVISGGALTLVEDPSFEDIARTDILGLKSSTVIFLAFAVVCAFMLNRTVFGRHIFATGGNLQAARLSGVPVARIQIATYMLAGFASALAGLIVASRTLSFNATTTGGTSLTFQAIAAILIGGISVHGGSGAVWRVIVGVLILAMISNGFNLNGVDPLYQDIVTGCIILLAVGIDAWARRQRA